MAILSHWPATGTAPESAVEKNPADADENRGGGTSGFWQALSQEGTMSGFTEEGLAALDAALARHAAAGAVPGIVALVARNGQFHVSCAGPLALGDSDPIGPDAIFRIASLTKPVTGVAAMLL